MRLIPPLKALSSKLVARLERFLFLYRDTLPFAQHNHAQ